jgi:hypothetical protein
MKTRKILQVFLLTTALGFGSQPILATNPPESTEDVSHGGVRGNSWGNAVRVATEDRPQCSITICDPPIIIKCVTFYNDGSILIHGHGWWATPIIRQNGQIISVKDLPSGDIGPDIEVITCD